MVISIAFETTISIHWLLSIIFDYIVHFEFCYTILYIETQIRREMYNRIVLGVGVVSTFGGTFLNIYQPPNHMFLFFVNIYSSFMYSRWQKVKQLYTCEM